MTKEFLPYDRALKLKQLGFDEECIAYYDLRNDLEFYGGDNLKDTHCVQLNTPLFQQAFRWFREEYNLFGCIDLQVCTPPHWFLRIDEISKNDYIFHSEDENYRFNTYEEAKLACIDKLIEIVELKNKDNEL